MIEAHSPRKMRSRRIWQIIDRSSRYNDLLLECDSVLLYTIQQNARQSFDDGMLQHQPVRLIKQHQYTNHHPKYTHHYESNETSLMLVAE